MSTGIEPFDHSLQLTNLRPEDLRARLGTDHRHLACLAHRTTLHALRERLPGQRGGTPRGAASHAGPRPLL